MEHFYADQPELSLRFYRRLLQMGVHNAELYNNLGLSCFYAQQYDMTLTCMERALSLAEEPEVIADVWYNLGHIGKKNACKKYYQFISWNQNTNTASTGSSIRPEFFNLFYFSSIIGLNLGDVNLAYQCFRLSLSSNHSHAEAFNNLGIFHIFFPWNQFHKIFPENDFTEKKFFLK